MKLLSIRSVKNLKDKKVLVRLDLNVPIQNGVVVDDYRIKQSLPTLLHLQKAKAKTIIISHLGEKGETLREVARSLEKRLKHVTFIPNVLHGRVLHAIEHMKGGDIVVLENIRTEEGEKKNDATFAKKLSELGELYVNDAFSASHREHASIVGIPKYLPSYTGLQLEKEVSELSKILSPKHPFVFILGGAKFGTKLPLLKKYAKVADTIVIGGALANNFIKAKGNEVGLSLIDTDSVIPETFLKAKNIFSPLDCITDKKEVLPLSGVGFRDKIYDVGPATIALIAEKIKNARMILMNGPMGNYELGFTGGTIGTLKAIVRSKGYSIVGGGDTVALVRDLKLEKKISFVSTGGGAMLDFLAFGTLPGIVALTKKPSSQKKG